MKNKTNTLYLVKVGKEWAGSKQPNLTDFKRYLNRNFNNPKINWGTLLIGKSAEEKSLELNINFDTTVNSLNS
jgi:hypothetical protein